jgi:hypothetical protein
MKAGLAVSNRTLVSHHSATREEQLARLTKVFWMFLTIACCTASFAQTAFYSATDINLSSYANGALIRSEPLDGAPDGAAAYRVLYKSQGLQGEPIAVSGVVIIPGGPPPANGPSNRRVGPPNHRHRCEMRPLSGTSVFPVNPGPE